MKKLVMLASAVVFVGASSAFSDTVIYDSLPTAPTPNVPFNVPSQGFQATQTAEFGDEVTLAPGGRQLGNVTVGLSDWAHRSTYMVQDTNGNWIANPGLPSDISLSATGYTVPLTFNIYAVNNSSAIPTVGTVLASKTINAFVQWCPEATIPDGEGGKWVASDGNQYHGLYTTVNFDFSSLGVTLPNSIIYGLAFNTETWGSHPEGIDGPYDSLNFAMADSGAGAPSVGSETNPGTVFWNTSTAGWYTDTGAAGVDVFRQDQGWAPYVPAVQITAVPLPAAAGIGFSMLGGFGALAGLRKRLSRKARVA